VNYEVILLNVTLSPLQNGALLNTL